LGVCRTRHLQVSIICDHAYAIAGTQVVSINGTFVWIDHAQVTKTNLMDISSWSGLTMTQNSTYICKEMVRGLFLLCLFPLHSRALHYLKRLPTLYSITALSVRWATQPAIAMGYCLRKKKLFPVDFLQTYPQAVCFWFVAGSVFLVCRRQCVFCRKRFW